MIQSSPSSERATGSIDSSFNQDPGRGPGRSLGVSAGKTDDERAERRGGRRAGFQSAMAHLSFIASISFLTGPVGVLLRAVLGLVLPLAVASTASATPIISELFYDASGSDDGKSFVELFGEPGSVLDGMVLEGVNGSNGAIGPVVTLSGVIPESGLFLVADRISAGTSEVLAADLLANFDFQNGPDSVVLRLGEDVLDAVGYGQFDPDEIFAGEGLPAEDPPAGWSLARVYADVDSDDNSFDFIALEEPTPGVAVFSPVPEPDTGLLMGGGLVLLAAGRRRVRRRR